MRPRARAVILLVAVAAAAVVLAVHPPQPGAWYPQCPTWAFLGLHCPGCGSTRACGALVRGDLAAAWRFNPALVAVGLPLLGWSILAAVVALARGTWPRAPIMLPPRAGWWIAALLMAYMVLRNVPVAALDWLRPPENR